MIAGANLIFNASTPSPSIYILVPVIGTVLVLLCTSVGTIAHRILTWRPFVRIGLISYSAYLWHQPLFAFARIRMIEHPGAWVYAGLSVAAFVLAYFSWRFVEAPFRRPGMDIFKEKPLMLGGAAALASFVGFGALGYAADGLPQRMPAQAKAAMQASVDKGNYRTCLSFANMVAAESGGGCKIGQDKQTIDFLVVGDSFAAALADGMDIAAKNAGLQGLLYVANSCPASVGLGGAYRPSLANCKRVQDSMVDVAGRLGVSRVYLVSNWRRLSPEFRCELASVDCSEQSGQLDAQIAESLRRTITAFNEAGVHPVFVGTPPRYRASVYVTMMKQVIHEESLADIESVRASQYPEYLRGALDRQEGLKWSYFDLSPFFCDDLVCRFSRDGAPAYWDAAHITSSKAKEIGAGMAQLLR
jgi:hypothetical protein